MKTLKNIFGIKESKNSLTNFFDQLDSNAMLVIKGGDDTEDLWPPITDDGNP